MLVGDVVTFTISAHAVEKTLVSSSIDDENDGVGDETRPNDATALAEQYRYAYAAAGEYTVRARVDHVGPYVGGRTAGSCYAAGEPLTWPGDSLPIEPGAGATLSLGQLERGTSVVLAQRFRQDRWAMTASGEFPYSCASTMSLHAASPGSDAVFATSDCGTTSRADPFDPTLLECEVRLEGSVP